LWVLAKWEVGHVVGFSLLEKYDFPDAKFTVYFLGYEVCKHCQLQASLETDILPGVQTPNYNIPAVQGMDLKNFSLISLLALLR
jgi:hypothetical protein